ncbi:hypothetical protein TNCV_4408451 [Trichonephila clavipes]|nr:hypothetical protein TNCV_4408451 [Trichonephila clavipes]
MAQWFRIIAVAQWSNGEYYGGPAKSGFVPKAGSYKAYVLDITQILGPLESSPHNAGVSREISLDIKKKRPGPPQEFRVTNPASKNSFEIEVSRETHSITKERRIVNEFKWIFCFLQLVGIKGRNYSRKFRHASGIVFERSLWYQQLCNFAKYHPPVAFPFPSCESKTNGDRKAHRREGN